MIKVTYANFSIKNVDFISSVMNNGRPCAAVAQLDRVFGYEPKGRGFESSRPRHFQSPNTFVLQSVP